jgi:hypothetical protein
MACVAANTSKKSQILGHEWRPRLIIVRDPLESTSLSVSSKTMREASHDFFFESVLISRFVYDDPNSDLHADMEQSCVPVKYKSCSSSRELSLSYSIRWLPISKTMRNESHVRVGVTSN